MLWTEFQKFEDFNPRHVTLCLYIMHKDDAWVRKKFYFLTQIS